MKKLLILSFILAGICTIVFTSCQREVGFDQNNATGDFRAKIDGSQWVATRATYASRQLGFIQIGGFGLDKKNIVISVTDSGVHRYTLNDVVLNAGTFQDSTLADVNVFSTNQSDDTLLAGGYVEITSIDTINKRISGKFSFRVYRQFDSLKRNITEGVFNNISYAPIPPPVNTTDTFRVKIAGSQWVPPTIFATKTNIPTTPPSSTIAVTGTNTTTIKSVLLTMPGDIVPGSYNLDLFGGTYIGLYNPDSDPNHSQGAVSGTLTILEHNTTTKRLRGNFNFRGETILPPTIGTDLTEGYFSVKYQ